ncbi:xanthine dehydrogenase family protein molybdopterin-binding subunit [Noviherbaspirillum pedocola]|uniref:Xanthine dehydrogenase family protein molybdopterin-binding subunit n=1 Tax=Noviherbaspirillum pedocola TaxID=2801341 RepID=A0A934W5W4_9BURK|nr:xanthine dehydrogenase family protein molybdopterin-binding subunit [Noviherbaspirillum pedocola]MBK4735462.1 xanthine dehydrogenase family protein molybdopterin-binding subunit [Noviherbaspirillum pedocola]
MDKQENGLAEHQGLQSPARRKWLGAGAALGGSLLIGVHLPTRAEDRARNERPPETAVGHAATTMSNQAPGLAHNAFIRIDRDNTVTLIIHKVEMGQGTFTSMPMLLAEELEVDLAKVKLEQAPADNNLYSDPLLGGQVTGGSTSVRGAWEPLRQAGAKARTVLIAAAAQRWKVDPASCMARDGAVIHQASGRKLSYGELVDVASQLPLPEQVALKPASQFRLIGKPMKRLDSAAKVDGSAQFGIDVRLPGMLIATVAACPVPGGRLKSVDEAKAMAVPGVKRVLKIEGAVAVLGEHMWAAKQGLAAAAPTWDEGTNANLTTAMIVDDMAAASKSKPGAVARNDGNAQQAIAGGKRKIEAVYEAPFLAHATMEPMNCTVKVSKDRCDLWLGTQVPTIAQGAAAKLTGLPDERVQVHNHYIGGGFGRRLEADAVIQAVQFAKQMPDVPIKIVWTREEDVQHDMYRPYYYDRLAAALDEKGMPVAWSHKITGSSIMARFAPPLVKNGVDPDAVEGAKDVPYRIENVHVEYLRHEPPLPTAFWRGVGPTHNIFVVESFIDELAAAAGQDPVAYRRSLLDDGSRISRVMQLAAEKAGWGKPLAKVDGRRMGRGISTQFAFGSYLAQVAEVSVGADGDVRVHRVVCAIDCGQVVNPDTVVAQIESGVNFGITAALWNEITVDKGRVQQSNFNDYRMMRINEAPRIEVHIVKSNDKPGGIGEPGTSATAPALTNAIFAATGQRIRKLPVGEQLKKGA